MTAIGGHRRLLSERAVVMLLQAERPRDGRQTPGAGARPGAAPPSWPREEPARSRWCRPPRPQDRETTRHCRVHLRSGVLCHGSPRKLRQPFVSRQMLHFKNNNKKNNSEVTAKPHLRSGGRWRSRPRSRPVGRR